MENSFYTPLPNTKTEKPNPKFESFSESLTHEILDSNLKPKLCFETKVAKKVILLEDQIPDYQKRKLLKNKKKSKLLNRKSRKKLEVNSIPSERHQFEFFVPLCELWLSYIKKTIKEDDAFYSNLLKSDFHGAIVTVVKSKNPLNIGISGIVVIDTENTFQIMTRNNKLKVIPKVGNNFTVVVNNKIVTVYGNHFRQRPDERVTKKYKPKPTVAL
jgi:ribonuclease P protein subunit POP4